MLLGCLSRDSIRGPEHESGGFIAIRPTHLERITTIFNQSAEATDSDVSAGFFPYNQLVYIDYSCNSNN
jgi:hypothetical protein